jgi:outer membrane protein assembly factor BamB
MSADHAMDGVDVQRTSFYPGKSVQRLGGLLWKSLKYFEINYSAGAKMGSDSTSIDYVEVGVSDPVIVNGLLYFRLARSLNQFYLFAIDQNSGEAVWRFDSKEFMSAPAIAGDTAYVETIEGILYALDAKTGQEKWRFVGKGEHWAVDSSPAVADGVIYFNGPGGSLYAVDLQTRQPKWTFKTKDILSAPALAGDTIFVGGGKSLHAISKANGQEQWNFKAKGRPGTPAISGGSVYFRTAEGTVYAVDIKTGQERWEAKAGGNVELVFPITTATIGTRLAAYGGEVFLAGADNGKNFLYAIDRNSGQQKWKFTTESPCHSPIATEDTVYVGCLGNFLAVDEQNGTKRRGIEAKAESQGKSRKVVASSPALSNGLLYFVTDDGYIYAVR